MEWTVLSGSQTVSKQLASEFEARSNKGLYHVGVRNRTSELTQVAGCKMAEGREGPAAGERVRELLKKSEN